VVRVAVRIDAANLSSASNTLRSDPSFVHAAIVERTDSLWYAAESLRNDRSFILEVMAREGGALQYVPLALRCDRQVVLTAVKQSQFAYSWASTDLQADREVAITLLRGRVVKSQPLLEQIIYLHSDDYDIALAVLSMHGAALQFASGSLRATRSVVLAAVGQAGAALQYAANELQADKEIAAIAALQAGFSPVYFEGKLCKVTGNRSVALLPEPSLSAEPRGDYLASGSVFAVKSEHVDTTSAWKFFELADGRGWVSERSRKLQDKVVVSELVCA